ncbi:branched-chain amino acid transport system ATP-binding protein [Frankia sp. AiPs1]|uniref:ABC transporter permease subunit n=1 Tax=Frankia sp. AiPa1 TaxID=573492 RepID=UPI00202AEDF2|nr:ATP-binding cassette domain-containing protein [Frankia sp. AiPa1]MCL9758533.1 ATP-binding cassette domain-containing protein [Frankia sp. AiPa1]
MDDVMGFALLSLGSGALYALVAAGVVVIARGAGVLNMAQGALVAWSAYALHGMHGPWGLPLPLAAVLAIASTSAIGVAFHVLVMRPLRAATALLRLMATLGLLIILESSLTLMFAGAVRTSPTVLPGGSVKLAGTEIDVSVFVRLGAVAALIGALWVVFRFTTLGLAATAATENPQAAATFGWSVDALAAAAWGVGAGLAGLAGVLLAPLQNPLSSTNLLLLIVPALAVALIGRFHSFPVVFVGGLALGLVEVETQYELVAHHPFWRGVDRAIPLAVIVFYLAVRGRGLPERGHVAERQPVLGSGRVHPRALAVLLAATLAITWWVLPTDWVDALDANALWALIILSVVVLVGFTGQLSLGQLAFSGIAALIAGRLVATRGWPLEAAMAVGVAGTALVGVLFALPALRTRGLQLAVVTLGLGAAVDALLFQRGYHSPPPERAGGLGSLFGDLARPEGTVVGHQRFLGIRLDPLNNPRGFATLSVVAFILVALAVANLRRGRAGRRLIAVRTNERAAAALGISVVGAKLYAFALSAAIAGFGGVLYAFYVFGENGNIDYGHGDFSPFPSIQLISYAVVGGVGWVSGSFAGALLVPGALLARLGVAVGGWLARLGWLLRVILATIGGLLGLAATSKLQRDPRTAYRLGQTHRLVGPSARRWLPWLGAVAVAAVAALLGGVMRHVLTHPDRYVPLIGGIILVVVLSRSGGGMAPENARAAGLLYDRFVPHAADRRRRADTLRLDRALGPALAPISAAVAIPGPPGPRAAGPTPMGRGPTDPAPTAPAPTSSAPSESGQNGPVPNGLGPAASAVVSSAPSTPVLARLEGIGIRNLVRRGEPATLSVQGLTVRFGGVAAVRGVDLRVEPGQVVGMIGPNGAGKTTVIDAITGYSSSTARSMTLGDVHLERLSAHRRARAGVSRSFQNLELFEDLTVLENIQAASDQRDGAAYLTDLFFPRSRPLPAPALAAIGAFGLRDDLLRTVSDLPYGRRRLLAIARAVAAGPGVLLLDEPCAGLDESESAEVAALLRRLADDWGLGILLNEHDMDVIMEVCDRVVVLDAGELIAEGSPAQVAANPRVRTAYLGDADPETPSARPPAPAVSSPVRAEQR